VIPEYLEKAACRYQSAATSHARATIGLALRNYPETLSLYFPR